MHSYGTLSVASDALMRQVKCIGTKLWEIIQSWWDNTWAPFGDILCENTVNVWEICIIEGAQKRCLLLKKYFEGVKLHYVTLSG